LFSRGAVLHALVGVPVVGVVGPAVPVLLNDVVSSLWTLPLLLLAFPDVPVISCAAVGPVVAVPLYIVDIYGVLFAVVARVPPVVDTSSATVAGIPAVANNNVSGAAGDLAAIVVLSIPAYTTSLIRSSPEDGFRLLRPYFKSDHGGQKPSWNRVVVPARQDT
jgi:hypothetical protein